MCRKPAARHCDANDFVMDLTDWLDGVKRRIVARSIVDEALSIYPDAASMISRSKLLRSEAKAGLAELKPFAHEHLKSSLWSKEDRALRLERQAQLKILQSEQLLHAALSHYPDSPEAHIALANQYRQQHQHAEIHRDIDAMARAETMLRAHASSLVATESSRASHFAYLGGHGALSLDTNPRGAEVLLHRYELKNRRLRPGFVRTIGKTPIIEHPLPMGSYLLIIRAKGHQEVRYPVHIGRQELWDGVPPNGKRTYPISLPPKGLLSENECYIPAGWFISGGDERAMSSLPLRRIWLNGFVMSRFPVTNSEYIEFMNHLVAEGLESDALAHAPRESTRVQQMQGTILYGRMADGRFCLKKDQDGDVWRADWPALKINWRNACAYAAYKSRVSGMTWRLPNEMEWEKSARGVDGRHFPWGDFLDPSWTCMRRSHSGRMLPFSVTSAPVDVSPFGVFGQGGNARDWTSSIYLPEGPSVSDGMLLSGESSNSMRLDESFYTVKGGSWYDQERFSRICSRTSELWSRGNANLSGRFVRGLNW